MFRNVCRQRSKAREARTVRVRKRTSIARGNSLTISTRCDGVWMKGRTDATATGSNKVTSRGNSKVSKANKVRKESRASRVNRDLKVDNKVGSSRAAGSPVARRTVAVSRTETGSVQDRIHAR